MNLPSDLKSYRAPDAFQIFTEEEAGYALFCLLALLLMVFG